MDKIEQAPNQRLRHGIREVLVMQYGLHEVKYHPAESGYHDYEPVEPIAHTVSDIYKCLHQGTFGVGHSIDNPQDFRRRLLNEMTMPKTAFTEPLLEKVSSDGSVLRVNLRPFRALFEGSEERGCDLLAQVCLESAVIETGDPPGFFFALQSFRQLNKWGELKAGKMIFSFAEYTVDGFLREIGRLTKSSGFIPVLSHSPGYRRLNNPSYRVAHLKALMRSPLATLIQSPANIESEHVH